MDKFLSDFPSQSWTLVQGYSGGFADGVRSVLVDQGVQLYQNYTKSVMDSAPCHVLHMSDRMLAAEGLSSASLEDVALQSRLTVPGVKDLSPRRAAAYHKDVSESFNYETKCGSSGSSGQEPAETFSLETWIAPHQLSAPSQTFLTTVADQGMLRTGWELRAQQYQEGYRWSCHVEEKYRDAPITLELFHGWTNGTFYTPLRASTLAKDLKIILESSLVTDIPGAEWQSGEGEFDGTTYRVYVMGVDPDDTICTFGNETKRSFVVHLYDVVDMAATDYCNKTLGSCRKTLNNDTSMNLGETSGRKNFNTDWNALVLGSYDARLRVRNMTGVVTLNNESYVAISGSSAGQVNPNKLELKRQEYHRWEYAVWNGTHENVVTGPRITTDPESGTHVTGNAFQTEWVWHHVVVSYDSSTSVAKLVVDTMDAVDLFYVTSDYMLSLENVKYVPTRGGVVNVSQGHQSVVGLLAQLNSNMLNVTISDASFFLEDIAIYTRILPPFEIQDHYYTMLDATMGQDACTPCQAGYDCQKDLTSDHIVVPSPCAAGKYRNQASTLVSCSKCPEGRYGLLRGLRHYTECQSCPEGELFFLFFFF